MCSNTRTLTKPSVFQKIGESLADPVKYENLFPGFNDSLRAESYLRAVSQVAVPASARAPPVAQRNVQEEIQQAVDNGIS